MKLIRDMGIKKTNQSIIKGLFKRLGSLPFLTAVGVFIVFSLLTLGCKPEEELVVLNPDAGPSFLDIENDGYFVILEAQPVRPGQSAVWRINTGNNGRFDDVHDPKTSFYGEPGESYELAWEVSEGNQSAAATITVSFKAMEPVIITHIENILSNNISLNLEAEVPKFGATGEWQIIRGDGGRFINQDEPKTIFIGKEKSEYTLAWTLKYGTRVELAIIRFTTDQLKVFAGEDQLDIKTTKEEQIKYYTLEASLPPAASGVWKIINNPTGQVFNIDNPNSLMQGIADSLYTLTWQVTLDDYISIDTVDLRFRGKWGIWEDSRDEQRYRFTEINDLEWMAENYNYAIEPGVKSWYYGHGYRSITRDGYPVETAEDRKKYGRLYTYSAARELAPEGWRLPTGAEIQNLINSQGGPLYAKEKLVEGGVTGLDLNYAGYYELSSSSDPALRNVFFGQDLSGYFFTQDYNPSNGYGLAYTISSGGGEVFSSVLPFNYYVLSVRYVRAIQK